MNPVDVYSSQNAILPVKNFSWSNVSGRILWCYLCWGKWSTLALAGIEFGILGRKVVGSFSTDYAGQTAISCNHGQIGTRNLLKSRYLAL